MINELAIKNFYQQHRDDYIAARLSGDTERYNEKYKWDILPELNVELKKYGPIDESNALQIVELLRKTNPNKGSFCHWIDLDNLYNQLKNKPASFKALLYLWSARPDSIGQEINAVNNLLHTFFSGEFKMSPAAYGYILAALDCNKFALFRESILSDLIQLNNIQKPQNQGEKYQLFNDTALYIGQMMESEKELYRDESFPVALNGQDFLYVTIRYPERDIN